MPSGAARAAAAPLLLQPFRGVRYTNQKPPGLAEVTMSPPALWDFAALADTARRTDHHVLRLMAPSLVGTETATAVADRWLAAGALTTTSAPSLYAWEWTHDGHRVVGVAGALPLAAGSAVAPHEQVRPALLAQRADELGDGRMQPEPVLLMYDGDRLLLPAGTATPTMAELTTGGERHRVGIITDPEAIAAIGAAAASQVLVVADGHHRLSVLGGLDPPRPRAFVLVVDVQRSDLAVGPIPRVVPELTWPTVLATPGARTAPLDAGAARRFLDTAPPDRLRWIVADRTRTVGLEMSAAAATALSPEAPQCGPLAADVCHLHAHLLAAWGADPARVRYAHSLAAARAEATATAGLVVEARPPTLPDVLAAARAQTQMPHKATSITPKPRAGLLMFHESSALD